MEDCIRVLIVDDMASIRKNIRDLLEKSNGFSVVGEAESGCAAVSFCENNMVDVILMDIEMEYDLAGIDASYQIIQRFPHCHIIILTVHDQDRHVFEAYDKGISDYLIKNSPSNDILQAIRDTYHGTSPIRPIIAEKMRREFQRVRRKEKSVIYMLAMLSRLTPTEIVILDLLASGKRKADICKIRYVELSTLKTQIRCILHKFGASSIKEVIEPLNLMQIFDLIRSYQRTDLSQKL